jgi:hypothetical protein
MNTPRVSDLPRRLQEKISTTIGVGCWHWIGATTGGVKGKIGTAYGQSWQNNRKVMAHRFVYELLYRAIPRGMTLDHLCRVRLCVNPVHMEIVSMKENVLRGIGPAARQAQRTHCIHGHELAGKNLLIEVTKKKTQRRCLTCKREASRRFRLRKKYGVAG